VDDKGQQQDSVTVLFDVTLPCDGCGSTSELFVTAVIGKKEFTTVYSRDLQRLFSNITGVDTIKQIEEKSCTLPTVGFSKVVTIELAQQSSSDGLITSLSTIPVLMCQECIRQYLQEADFGLL
jgi:hypothetical protein